MHFTTPLLLSLLSTTALALPTTNVTDSDSLSLDKRRIHNNVGWVGSFDNAKCSGPVAHNDVSFPKLDNCYQFTPVPNLPWVAINYGSGSNWETCVTFYTDNACKTQLGTDAVCQKKTEMTCSNSLGAARSFQLLSIEQ